MYLIRERNRLSSTIKEFLAEDRFAQVCTTCEGIFHATLRENRPRLIKKFHLRMNQTKNGYLNKDEGENQTDFTKQQKGLTICLRFN